MPIRGRTPGECFNQFAGHIRPLIQQVLGVTAYVAFDKAGDNCRDMHLSGHRSQDWLSLKSATQGDVYLYLAQDLVANKRAGSKDYELKTRQYWYKIYEQEPGPEDEPLFRWENVPPQTGSHCKYHFHVGKVFRDGKQESIELDSGAAKTNLTRLHIPTGYVLIEYVLRFLISDLGVKPACGDDRWEAILQESQDKFFSRFSPRGTST